MPEEGKKGNGTIEDEFEQLFDDFLETAKPTGDDHDDAYDEGRATPIMKGRPPKHPSVAEAPQDSADNGGDRPTPVYSRLPAQPSDEELDDSEKATKPAPEVDVQELFRLSTESSRPPAEAVVEQVREVAAVVLGAHPSLKPSPVPRVYFNGKPEGEIPPELPLIQNIPPPASPIAVMDEPDVASEFIPPQEPSAGPEIQIVSEEEVDEAEFLKTNMPLDIIRSKLDQCLFLYREMNIDFSRVFEEILGFKKDGKYLAAAQVQHVIHCFLNHMTELLAKHLIEGKTNIIQTKTGHLAGKLMHRAAHVRNGRVECDGATLVRFQRIQGLLGEIPEHAGIWHLTDDFIASSDLNALFQV